LTELFLDITYVREVVSGRHNNSSVLSPLTARL